MRHYPSRKESGGSLVSEIAYFLSLKAHNSLNFQPIRKILVSKIILMLGTRSSSHELVHIAIIFRCLIRRQTILLDTLYSFQLYCVFCIIVFIFLYWGCATHKGILFWTSNLAKGMLLAILVEFSLARVCFLAILVKELHKLGNFCKKNQN